MQTGDTIGKYQLVTRLGAGGMGEVWLAMALGYGGFAKPVVLKTLLPEYESDPMYIEMLAHEARTCAKLNHPNLIEVFDFSRHGRTYLLAMEHVLGESLSQILRMSIMRKWPIPAWFALRVAWECCRGLEHAHEQGVIHCDLSPSNVMVTFTGVTKILDFGVAHSCADGDKADRLKGKWSYMAPERLQSLSTDRRTDVYALGVMLYLLFVGRLPYQAANDEELLRLKLKPPARPSGFGPIDETIEQIIMRCLEPDPAARYDTAHDVLEALSPSLDGSLGAYGQHDAAAFMKRLFDDRTRPAAETAPLPHIRVNVDEDSRAITVPASDDQLEDFDIEVVSEVIPLEVRLPTVPAHAKALGKGTPLDGVRPIGDTDGQALAQGSVPPIAHDAIDLSSPGPARATPLSRPLLGAFLPAMDPSADPVHESRTTVQSLFSDRRSMPSPTTNVFGSAQQSAPRPQLESTSDAAWPWAVSRVKQS